MQLLCSTGTFSRFPDYVDYHIVLRYGPLLDVSGFELMFYPSWYGNAERIGSELRASGLAFPAMHTEKSIGVSLGKPTSEEREQGIQFFAENCRLAEMLNTRVLVLHLWNWPDLDDHLENNLQALPLCLDIAAQHHVQLAVETIPGRHHTPLDNVQRAVEYDARCHVALDTEFLAQYDQLEEVFHRDWLWQNGRVSHVHIKDYDGKPFVDGARRYLHPGEGNIDFERFFHNLKQRGFNGNVSLESPAVDATGQVAIKHIQQSLTFIRRYLS
ncbi:MAG TPA: hypothetical protein DHW02_05860 [Ktedonobacter sp.]|nr:hypothetical protein [Ktedonobacter sp.]